MKEDSLQEHGIKKFHDKEFNIKWLTKNPIIYKKDSECDNTN